MPFQLPKPIAWVAALSVAVPLVLPAVAVGARVYAPPGSSAVQEFLETLPDGAGNVVTDDVANALPEPPRSGTISPETQRALEEGSPRGGAAVALAETTAVADVDTPPVRVSAGTDGKSPLVAVLERLGAGAGPGGMGLALPIAIVLSLLAAIRYGLRQPTVARLD